MFAKAGFFIVKMLSRIPFGVMYVLSDISSWMLFHVIRYRRSVVMGNLSMCFPEKSSGELKK